MAHNPYQAPVAQVDTPVTGLSGTYGAFRNNGTLKSIIVSLLVLDSMLVIFNSGVLNYLDMQQFQSDDYWLTDEPSQLDNIIGLTSTVQAILSVIIMVIFAAWINRSCKNAWLLDPPRMSITPARGLPPSSCRTEARLPFARGHCRSARMRTHVAG